MQCNALHGCIIVKDAQSRPYFSMTRTRIARAASCRWFKATWPFLDLSFSLVGASQYGKTVPRQQSSRGMDGHYCSTCPRTKIQYRTTFENKLILDCSFSWSISSSFHDPRPTSHVTFLCNSSPSKSLVGFSIEKPGPVALDGPPSLI